MKRTFPAALLTLIAIPSPACAAQIMTAGDLQEFCTAPDDASKSGCRYFIFIFGVAQGLRLAAGALGDKTHFCIPDNLSAKAIELAVKMAMGQDLMVFPQDRDLEASGFVGGALKETFPCRKQ